MSDETCSYCLKRPAGFVDCDGDTICGDCSEPTACKICADGGPDA